MLIRQTIDVEVYNNKDPIEVEVVERGKGELQNLKIEGNLLTISGGNTVELPTANIEGITTEVQSIKNHVEVLNNRIDSTNKAINNLPVPLSESEIQSLINQTLPESFITEEKVQDIINNSVDLTSIQNDINMLKSKDSEYFEEIDLANNALFKLKNDVNNLKQSVLTNEEVQSMIDAAIGDIVDGEGVRY